MKNPVQVNHVTPKIRPSRLTSGKIIQPTKYEHKESTETSSYVVKQATTYPYSIYVWRFPRKPKLFFTNDFHQIKLYIRKASNTCRRASTTFCRLSTHRHTWSMLFRPHFILQSAQIDTERSLWKIHHPVQSLTVQLTGWRKANVISVS